MKPWIVGLIGCVVGIAIGYGIGVGQRGEGGPAPATSQATGESDPDGAVRPRQADRGGDPAARAPDGATQRKPVVVEPGRIEVTLVGPNGAAIESPVVRAQPAAEGSSPVALELTDAGTFAAALDPGEYTLRVAATGCRTESRPTTITSQATQRLTFDLVPGATVAGRVANNNERSVPGTVVHVTDAAGQELGTTEADAYGRFEFAGLPAEPLTCSATHAAFGAGSVEVTATLGEPVKCTLTLASEHVLEGIVVAADGSGLGKALVMCMAQFPPTSGTSWMDTTSSAADGSFSFESVPAGVKLWVQVRHHGYQVGQARDLVIGDTPLGVIRIETEVIEGECKVTATVLGADGEPITAQTGAWVNRAGTGNATGADILEGKLEFTVPHGTYSFRTMVGGHAEYRSEKFDTAGQPELDLGTIQLTAK